MASTVPTRERVLFVPLRGPLTVAFVLLVIVTTVATGWVSYRAAFHSLRDEALASLRSAATARDNRLVATIARKREQVQSTLQAINLGCGTSGVMLPPCARDMLRPFLRTEHAYGAALYYGRTKPVRVGSFRQAQSEETPPGLPTVQMDSFQRPYVRLSQLDRESGLTLAVDFSVAEVMKTTEVLRTPTRIVSRVRGSESGPGADRTWGVGGSLGVSQLSQCLAGSEGWGTNRPEYISFLPSRALADTCVAALRDEQEILAPLSRLAAKITRVGMGFGVLALALAYLSAMWLARPLVRLRQRVRTLRQGDYDSPVPIVGVGEMRELALAFSSLKDSVRAYRATLAENERRLTLVYKAARLWIWEHDLSSGAITWRDPAGEREPERMRFRVFLQGVHREDRHLVCEAVRSAKISGTYEVEYRTVRPGGSIVWMSSWGQASGPLWQRMIGVSLDITARKNAENLIRERDRLEASAELAGSLAHEINNPLTAITGALYMLDQSPLAAPTAARYLEIARKETRRVAQLVNQILGLYHQPAPRVAIDVRSLLHDVVASCRTELDATHQSVVLGNSQCGIITGCREELVHAFSNILRNSIESSPAESEIHIRAHHAYRWRNGEGTGVRVVIADAGPGIPANQLARVFDAFTGTKSQKGTGLGLWVARSTILKHGGTIRFRVAYGKHSGTIVSVFLPARSHKKPVSSAKDLQSGPSALDI